jgi:DNA polymerase-3 subunit gamma/tau
VPTPWEAASQAVSVAVPPLVESVSAVATVETPPQPGSASFKLDFLRDGICGALESSGHNTAAALLSSGVWTETDGKVRVEVLIKKTMLGLTMNAEAEKIVKSAAREAGYSGAVSVVSAANGSEAANGSQPPPAKRPATAGSVQAEALAHPLVKHALELFNGEVRSILDLREKKNA